MKGLFIKMKRIRGFKRDFELDLLLALDELTHVMDNCFSDVSILLEMRERGYFQDAKDDEKIVDMIEKYKSNGKDK